MREAPPISPEEINTILGMRWVWAVRVHGSRQFIGDTIGITWSQLVGGIAIWACAGRFAVGITVWRELQPQLPKE